MDKLLKVVEFIVGYIVFLSLMLGVILVVAYLAYFFSH